VVGDRRQPEPGAELGERDENGAGADGQQEARSGQQPAKPVQASQRGGVTWATTPSSTLSEVLPATSASG
jgi:hypothetical protein